MPMTIDNPRELLSWVLERIQWSKHFHGRWSVQDASRLAQLAARLLEDRLVDEDGVPCWVCLSCGNMDRDKMHTEEYVTLDGTDYDMMCNVCDGVDFAESRWEAIQRLIDINDERHELNTKLVHKVAHWRPNGIFHGKTRAEAQEISVELGRSGEHA